MGLPDKEYWMVELKYENGTKSLRAFAGDYNGAHHYVKDAKLGLLDDHDKDLFVSVAVAWDMMTGPQR